MLLEFGIQTHKVGKCDSAAARGKANRSGTGRLKHLELKQIWIQKYVRDRVSCLRTGLFTIDFRSSGSRQKVSARTAFVHVVLCVRRVGARRVGVQGRKCGCPGGGDRNPEEVGARRWGLQNFALFFSLFRSHFRFFFSPSLVFSCLFFSLSRSSRGIFVVFEAPGP